VTTDSYTNELERRFYSLPDVVQVALHEPFMWMNDALRQVAGQPQELLAAGWRYVRVAEMVRELGDQQTRDRTDLAAAWSGEAFQSFDARMRSAEAQLADLAAAVRSTNELLEAGAQACVEGANMIIEIVSSLIMFALSTLAVNGALAVLTGGATMAAWLAGVTAKTIKAMADVVRVLEKTAVVLRKVVLMLEHLRHQLGSIVSLTGQAVAEPVRLR
jgi:uncharacterized protein YukE